MPHGLVREWQLLRTGFGQGAGRYPQEGLVPSRLARKRRLLHPLRVRSCERPSIIDTFKRLAAANKCLAQSNKFSKEREATKERETGCISDIPLSDFR